MQMISEKVVAALPAPANGNRVHFFSGATLQGKKAPAGFGVRVTAGGTKSFVLFHRVDGRKYLETIGRWDENPQGGTLTVRDAIIKAGELAKALANGKREDPRPERTRRLEDADKPKGLTISGMLDQFVDRYCRKEKNLRSADRIESDFERLVKPDIGDYGIYEIRRSHVIDMLDEIADENGPVMAHRTLACFRKACNWYAVRDDEFNSPIVKGMRAGASNPRNRILDDQEIRDVWAALDELKDVPACYSRYIKLLLLTASRRTEASQLHSLELELDADLWTIPAARYKTGIDHVIPLSKTARELIGGKPDDCNANGWFVFTTTYGAKPFSGFSKAKRELDKAVAEIRKRDGREEMPRWVLHDLRRTARTLMSRAKVSPDHAERCLGHVIGGVRGVYDRYDFLDEKRAGFAALAAMVAAILDPPTANVVQSPGA
jgi:integrase